MFTVAVPYTENFKQARTALRDRYGLVVPCYRERRVRIDMPAYASVLADITQFCTLHGLVLVEGNVPEQVAEYHLRPVDRGAVRRAGVKNPVFLTMEAAQWLTPDQHGGLLERVAPLLPELADGDMTAVWYVGISFVLLRRGLDIIIMGGRYD